MLTSSSIAEPTVKETRDVLPLDSRHRSMTTGVAYFAGTAALYLVTFALLASADGWPARIGLAVVNGLVAGMMFIVGHDACHGSLTPSSKVNTWLARLAFLPSWHPAAAWEAPSTRCTTAGRIFAARIRSYCPMTLDEFRALSPMRRSLSDCTGRGPESCRCTWRLSGGRSRSTRRGEHRRRIDKRRTYVFDRRLVGLFIAGQLALLAALNVGAVRNGAVSMADAVARVATVTVLPFLVFAWLMAFATFQHHTHPRVIWYDDEAEWSFYRSQVEGTVHVEFPRWIELLLHNIMEHTAHHIDTRVPLYHLNDAQRAVEAAFGTERVITERFSFAGMSRVFRVCQLYDYGAHQWLSFSGHPTSAPRVLQAEAATQQGSW